MEHRVKDQKNAFTKRKTLVAVAGLVGIICIIIAIVALTMPERSVASFCRVAKEEKPILTGNINYEKRLDSYKKLEAVSPGDIRPDITTIRKGYEEIIKTPSNALNTGFGMSGSENRRTAYINANCKDF